MSVQDGERLATKQDLADMYQEILPYLGGVPEMLANKFSKGDLYDTSEKMIGKWIDGKPLYQKVVETTLKGTWSVATTIEGADFLLVRYAAIYINDGTNDWLVLNYDSGSTGNSRTIFGIKGNTIKTLDSGGTYANKPLMLIVQYTKTTDQANSFNIGEATDYSTEEKIVGTWIDGSPIFQRTVQMTLPAKNTDATLNVSSWNINLVVSCQGTSASMQSAPMTTYVGDGNYHYHCFVNMPNKLLYVRNLGSTLGVGDVGYVTVQYTKTT